MQWQVPLLLGLGLMLGGCASDRVAEASPTVRLLRGELSPDQYAGAITAANEQSNAQAQFEVNKPPTRAYNTVTGKYEYVPEDTQQRWSDANQRWEFTPVDRNRKTEVPAPSE